MTELTNAQIFALTPEQATVHLGEMTVQYAAANIPPAPAVPGNAMEARARLTELSKDPNWSQRFLNSDLGARKEFDGLVSQIEAGDDVELAMANLLPLGRVDSGPGAPLREQAAAVPKLREMGINDDTIRQLLSDAPISAKEQQMVKHLHAQRFSDKEWVGKLMANNWDARREFTLMSIVLASTVDPALK